MKVPTFQEILSVLNHEGLYTSGVWHFGGAFKTIEGYSCQNTSGVKMVDGYRHEWPELYIDNDVVKVNVHAIATQTRWTLTDTMAAKSITLEHWSDVEALLADSEVSAHVFHRSRKTGLALSRYIASLQERADGTVTQKVTDSIMRLARCEVIEYDYEWLTGDALVEWYENHDDNSHSCMTGEGHCEKTRVWSTNGNQCRLLVLSENGHEFARCLCFRPCVSLDASNEEVPLGPGWAFSRVYSVGHAHRAVDNAINWMNVKGMVEIGHRSMQNGVVPLIVTELSPYIDRGSIFINSTTVGSKALFLPPAYNDVDRLRVDGWRSIVNNQHGEGFGRRNQEGDCECASCNEFFDSDEMTYVTSYGDVCGDCFSNGDFVEIIGGDYYHADDTIQVRSELYELHGDHINSGAEGRSLILIRKSDESRVRVRLVRAIDIDGESLLCPEEEVKAGAGGTDSFYIGTDADKFVEVSSKMMFRNGVAVVSPITPGILPKDDCVQVDGAMCDMTRMDYSFANLMRTIPNVSFSTELYNSVMVNGHRMPFYQSGNDYVVLDNDLIVMHTSSSYNDPSRHKVGDKFNGMPLLRMIANPLSIDESTQVCNVVAFIDESSKGFHSGSRYGNGVRMKCDTINDDVYHAMSTLWHTFNPINDSRYSNCMLRAVDSADPDKFTSLNNLMVYRNYVFGVFNNEVVCMFAGANVVVMNSIEFSIDSADRRNAIKTRLDACLSRNRCVYNNHDYMLVVARDFANFNQGAAV